MGLIIILVALAVDKMMGLDGRYRSWEPYFAQGIEALQGRVGESYRAWIPVVLLLAVWVGLGLVYSLASVNPLIQGVVGLLLFWASLGTINVQQMLTAYQANPDEQSAYQPLLAAGGGDAADIDEQVSRGAYYQANDTMFAVIFWMAVLGPLAAVGYRFLGVLADHWQRGDKAWANQVKQLQAWAAWIPARLLAFTFALVGKFAGGYQAWKAHFWQDNEQILGRTGEAAVELHPLGKHTAHQSLPEAALYLLGRSLFAWVLIIAMLTVWWYVF